MDQTLRKLKDEFQHFVGQPINVRPNEIKRVRRVAGEMQEVVDRTLSIDWEDPVVKEMATLGKSLGTQVRFAGVMYAGLGGTEIVVELTDNGHGQLVITDITPRYC